MRVQRPQMGQLPKKTDARRIARRASLTVSSIGERAQLTAAQVTVRPVGVSVQRVICLP